MRQLKIVPMEIARVAMDRSHMMYFYGMGQRIINPQMAWYINGAKEHILVDTGFNAELASKLGYDAEHVKSIEEHLKEKLNLIPDDIDIVLYTHLHLDHCSSSASIACAAFLSSG